MRRMLFITSSRIGDSVLSTGLLAHLASNNPGVLFTVACGAVAAPLFASAPFVERVIPMVKRRRAGHWADLWRATVGTLWCDVFDLRSSAISWLLPTWRRHIIRSSWKEQHRLIHISSAIGAREPFPPVLWNSPRQSAEAAALIPQEQPVLAVGPCANWGAKQWPAERFVAVINRLTGPQGIFPGARVALFGAKAERSSAAPLLDALAGPRLIDLIGTIDLATAHACIKRCAFYLGNDSGLMHIAAASGIPTLGLFGPSSEIFYGPWGTRCASVRGPRSFEDICHAPDFDHRSQDCMMLDLTEDAVEAAARSLWGQCALPA